MLALGGRIYSGYSYLFGAKYHFQCFIWVISEQLGLGCNTVVALKTLNVNVCLSAVDLCQVIFNALWGE